MFHEIQSLRNFILKYLPSVRITISAPVLRVDKANANDINKAFAELVKESNLDYISHENIKESHIDEYGLHINRTGSSILAKNLISGIRNFWCFSDSNKEVNIDGICRNLTELTFAVMYEKLPSNYDDSNYNLDELI